MVVQNKVIIAIYKTKL